MQALLAARPGGGPRSSHSPSSPPAPRAPRPASTAPAPPPARHCPRPPPAAGPPAPRPPAREPGAGPRSRPAGGPGPGPAHAAGRGGSGERAMAVAARPRVDQFVGECLVKAAHIVLGTRVFQAARPPPAKPGAKNWVRLRCEQCCFLLLPPLLAGKACCPQISVQR